MYHKVKELSTGSTGRKKMAAIMGRYGNLFLSMADIRRRRKTYIEELYNRKEKPADVGIEKKDENAKDDKGPTIVTCEVIEAMKKLESEKLRVWIEYLRSSFKRYMVR